MSDPQSFLGWFRNVPLLAAPHHPYRIGLLLIQRPSERVVLRRTVYIAVQEPPIALGQHYAPGTKQNHPAEPALRRRDPGRRRVLVPAVPEAVLEHDARAERPLPPRRQSVGRSRQPRPLGHRDRDPEPARLNELRLAPEAVRPAAPRARVLLRSAHRRKGREGVPLRRRRLRPGRDRRLRGRGWNRAFRRRPEHRGRRRRRRPLARLLAHHSDGASWPAGEKACAARSHREDVGTCPFRRAKGRPVREPAARRRTDAVQGLRRARGRPDRRRAGQSNPRPDGADRCS